MVSLPISGSCIYTLTSTSNTSDTTTVAQLSFSWHEHIFIHVCHQLVHELKVFWIRGPAWLKIKPFLHDCLQSKLWRHFDVKTLSLVTNDVDYIPILRPFEVLFALSPFQLLTFNPLGLNCWNKPLKLRVLRVSHTKF